MVTRERPEKVANVTLDYANHFHTLHDQLYLGAKNVLTTIELIAKLDIETKQNRFLDYLDPVLSEKVSPQDFSS